MCKCKAHATQIDLCTFRLNQAYPGIIQAYLDIFKVTLAYLEPWYIQNRGIFRSSEAYSKSWHVHNPGIFRTLAYSECWHIQILRHIQNPVKYLQ